MKLFKNNLIDQLDSGQKAALRQALNLLMAAAFLIGDLYVSPRLLLAVAVALFASINAYKYWSRCQTAFDRKPQRARRIGQSRRRDIVPHRGSVPLISVWY